MAGIERLDEAYELSTAWLRGTIHGDGAALAGSALATLTLTCYDQDTGTILNSRNRQSVLGVNGGSVSEAGALEIELAPADNAVVTALRAIEEHVALLEWTWPAVTPTKTGHMVYLIPVINLGKTPAA